MDIQIIFNKVKGSIKVAAVVDKETLADNPSFVEEKMAKLHNARILVIKIPDEKITDLYKDRTTVLSVS